MKNENGMRDRVASSGNVRSGDTSMSPRESRNIPPRGSAPSDRRYAGNIASSDAVFSSRRNPAEAQGRENARENYGRAQDAQRSVSPSRQSSAASGHSHGTYSHSAYNGHSSRRRSSTRKRRKKIQLNSTVITIVLSVVVSVIIILGVVINYIANLNDTNIPAEDTNDTAATDTTGNSVTQTIELYTLDAAEVTPEISFPVIKVYDAEGRLTVSPVRQENGDIDGTLVYEYSSEGICILEKRYGRDGKLTYKSVVGGIEDGVARTLYETEFDNKNNYTGYTETFYDENGIIIGKTECSYNGVIEGKFDYVYDEEGRVLRENRYTPYGDLSVYTEYKYDSFGNNTEVIQYDSSGKEVLRDVTKYDAQSRVVLEEHYTVGVCKSYVEYTYDEYGNVYQKKFILKDEHTMTYEQVPN